MDNSETELDNLFRSYREACPDIEPGAQFMPSIWHKIESRQNFVSVFERFGKAFATASAALCLVLVLLNLVSAPMARNLAPSYADALMADHTAEKTSYAEALRSNSSKAELPVDTRR